MPKNIFKTYFENSHLIIQDKNQMNLANEDIKFAALIFWRKILKNTRITRKMHRSAIQVSKTCSMNAQCMFNGLGDGYENVKRAKRLIRKTTTCTSNTPFLQHMLLPDDYDEKCLISRFTKEAIQRRRNFLSLSELGYDS